MEEPRGAPDLSLSLETGGEPESHPPRAPTPIPEPLLNNPRCARTSSIDGDGSASNVSCPHADPLHVQFDAHSPSAPLAISSASTSSSNDKERSTATATLPDGGYGWVIVLAAFMLYLIAGGITFTFRLFFLYFLNYFGGSIEKAIWTSKLFTVMPLLSGPIASFLIGRYGCRQMTIFGSFLAALGFIISAFVDNVETLMFTFGIMAGFGLSLCYVAAVVIIAHYFEKKRSLATGISLCGSGIGTFVFASLTKYYDWLEKYEWRGTNLILAGLLLNMVVCGLLFRDLPWMITMNGERAKERKHRRERKRNKLFGSSTDSFSHSKSAAGFTKATDAVDIEGVMTSTLPQHSTLVDLPTYMTGGERVSLETFESTQSPVYTTLAQNYPGTLVSPVTTSRRKLSSNDSVSSAPKTSGTKQLTALSLLTSFQKQMQWYAGLCWVLIVDILGFSLFLNPAFLVFAVSNFLLHMWHNVPEVYIRDIGFSESMDMSQLAKLIPIISILNMFGQAGSLISPTAMRSCSISRESSSPYLVWS
ncbi:monocarboxylate transporter 7-like [Maniola jurtina]|uniref:monocarboxylate transporter 7-like n=1 Tax=Maniola jurtina TaxID=191418 RepID=UPI001E68ED9C|nr:monocarboxylate transporter 7-like [Maniola jurtina]